MDASLAFRRSLLRQLLIAGGVSLAALGATACTTDEVCIDHAKEAACPPPEDASADIAAELDAGEFLVSVDGSGQREGEKCCYQITTEESDGNVVDGRPLMTERGALFSPPVERHDWKDAQLAPDVAALNAAERAELARIWTDRALAEHASVASFGRFSLELMALGAPPELLADAHRAALDEVHHASAAFALASAYAGEPVGPGALPLKEALPLRCELTALAVSTAVEACVNETLAVIVAAEELALCKDEAVREVLSTVVLDETRHAELAWRSLAWAVSRGDAELSMAVFHAVLAARPGAGGEAEWRDDDPRMRAHGVLDSRTEQRVRSCGYEEVVLPSIRALIDGGEVAQADLRMALQASRLSSAV